MEILRETGVGSEQNFAEFVLGFDLLWHWDLKEAEKQFLIALQASERTGDVTTETRCLTYLTVTYRKLGDVPNVKTYAARSLEAAAIGQMIEYIGMAQANLAWAARREGKILEAQKLAEAAWETLQKTIQSQMFSWVAVWPLIGIYLAQNRTAEAIEFARMLLAPTTQPQPETIAALLQAAIQAWEQEPVRAGFCQSHPSRRLSRTSGLYIIHMNKLRKILASAWTPRASDRRVAVIHAGAHGSQRLGRIADHR